jgi:hypothetical protein
MNLLYAKINKKSTAGGGGFTNYIPSSSAWIATAPGAGADARTDRYRRGIALTGCINSTDAAFQRLLPEFAETGDFDLTKV